MRTASRGLSSTIGKNSFCPKTERHKAGGVQAKSAQLIWNYVYSSRVAKLAGCDENPLSIFPGLSPALSKTVSAENFALDRAKAIFANQLFINDDERNSFETAELEAASWIWQSVARPNCREIACSSTASVAFDPTLQMLLNAATNKESVRILFDAIHKSWSATTSNYGRSAFGIAADALLQLGSRATLAAAFELEEYASYCTLRDTFSKLHSKISSRRWVDIGTRKPEELRASERCLAYRLIRELENLAAGRTAPLLVNEFNCVADGNHRLTAAWIWNALHWAKEARWEQGNLQFEKRLLQFFSSKESALTNLSINNALTGLSSIFTNTEDTHRLEALRNAISLHGIKELPVIPILSYSGLAIDRQTYTKTGTIRRFTPKHYQILRDDPAACLTAKACFHFADKFPLPLFDVIRLQSKTNFIDREDGLR